MHELLSIKFHPYIREFRVVLVLDLRSLFAPSSRPQYLHEGIADCMIFRVGGDFVESVDADIATTLVI